MTNKTRYQTINVNALVRQLEGPPKPYVVYRFKNRKFLERPGHNPFKRSGEGNAQT